MCCWEVGQTIASVGRADCLLSASSCEGGDCLLSASSRKGYGHEFAVAVVVAMAVADRDEAIELVTISLHPLPNKTKPQKQASRQQQQGRQEEEQEEEEEPERDPKCKHSANLSSLQLAQQCLREMPMGYTPRKKTLSTILWRCVRKPPRSKQRSMSWGCQYRAMP